MEGMDGMVWKEWNGNTGTGMGVSSLVEAVEWLCGKYRSDDAGDAMADRLTVGNSRVFFFPFGKPLGLPIMLLGNGNFEPKREFFVSRFSGLVCSATVGGRSLCNRSSVPQQD